MKFLGLIGFGYNPGAALVVDGKLVAHCEEERLTRFKGSHFLFPSRSAAWCLQSQGYSLDDVDAIAWGWDQDVYPYRMARFFLRQALANRSASSSTGALKALAWLIDQHPRWIRQRIVEGLRAGGLRGRIPELRFLSHHRCHAASSYYLSGFDEANVLVIDGSGEMHSSSIFHGSGKTLREVDRIEMPNSLGWFYAAITEYLGFTPYRDEGKLMGLAAYGKRSDELEEKFDRILRIEGDGYRLEPRYALLGSHTLGRHYSDELAELLGPPRFYGEALRGHEQDIAFACQDRLERAAAALLRRAQRSNPSPNLCLAGGVALNCKMNGFLRTQPGVERAFAQPSSSDAGTALGAAIVLSLEAGEFEPFALEHVFYGPGFDAASTQASLDAAGVRYQRCDDLPRRIAESLERGQIVAVQRGAMEFGARALGHRSILANPLAPGMRDRVNQRVKFREAWRPFCPSLQEEARARYFEPADISPFMTLAYRATASAQRELPAVVHVDGTLRPQTVRRDVDPFYWQILQEFGARSGHPILLNTSFNIRSQPIIADPQSALACLFSTGLDALALGDFWIQKD